MAVQMDILRERGKQMVLEDDARDKISVCVHHYVVALAYVLN